MSGPNPFPDHECEEVWYDLGWPILDQSDDADEPPATARTSVGES